MQYIECTFQPLGRKYSYSNDGEPVSVGDFVDVQVGNHIKTVEVVGILSSAPQLPAHVQLKSIIGRSVNIPE